MQILDIVTEGSTSTWEFDLLDEADAPVPKSAFTSFTYTLYNADADDPRAAAAIINSRDHVNLLTAGAPLFAYDDGLGRGYIRLTELDNVVLDRRLKHERHIGLLEMAWPSGRTKTHEAMIRVGALRRT